MSQRQVVARSLNELGLAAWFGGSLMGAVGLNESGARDAGAQTTQVASSGWSAWTPVNLAAIGAHLAGGALLTVGNRRRIGAQQGVAAASIVKTAVTAAALGATGYSRLIGQRVIDGAGVDAEGGAEPSERTPPEVASAQRQLRYLQWAIPALTGTLVVLDAVMGEQQKPTEVARGAISRLNPLA